MPDDATDGQRDGERERPSHLEVRRATLEVVRTWPATRFIEEDVAGTVFEALALSPEAVSEDDDVVLRAMLRHVLAELCDEKAVLRQLVDPGRREWLQSHRPEASHRTTVWERIAASPGEASAVPATMVDDELRGTLVSGELRREEQSATSPTATTVAEEQDAPPPSPPVSTRPPGDVSTAIRKSAAAMALPAKHSARRLRRARTPVGQLAARLRLGGVHVDTTTVAAAWLALQATGRLLLAGPTGVGKSRLVRALVDALPAPQYVANVTWVPADRSSNSNSGSDDASVGFLQQALQNYQDMHAESLAWFLAIDDLDMMPRDGAPWLEELLACFESPVDPLTSVRLREWVAPSGRGVNMAPNVYWIGTLNTDLAGPSRLSPRLLDRVFWVELEEPGLDSVLAPQRDEVVGSDVELQAALLQGLRGDEHWQRGRFVRPYDPATDAAWLPASAQPCLDALERLQRLLRPHGGTISARAACEIAATLAVALETETFAAVVTSTADTADCQAATAAPQAWLALDVAVAGKVLPRLFSIWRTNREERRNGLAALYDWALDPQAAVPKQPAEADALAVGLAEPPPDALLRRTASTALREWQRIPSRPRR